MHSYVYIYCMFYVLFYFMLYCHSIHSLLDCQIRPWCLTAAFAQLPRNAWLSMHWLHTGFLQPMLSHIWEHVFDVFFDDQLEVLVFFSGWRFNISTFSKNKHFQMLNSYLLKATLKRYDMYPNHLLVLSSHPPPCRWEAERVTWWAVAIWRRWAWTILRSLEQPKMKRTVCWFTPL